MRMTALGDDRTQLIDSLTQRYVQQIKQFEDPCKAVSFLFDKMFLTYKMLPLVHSIESGKVSMKKPASFSPDEQKNVGALVNQVMAMADAMATHFPETNFDEECPKYSRYTHYLNKFNDAIEIISQWAPIDPAALRKMDAKRSAAIDAGNLDFPLISDQAKAFYIRSAYMGDLKDKPRGKVIRDNYLPSGELRSGKIVDEKKKEEVRKKIYKQLEMEIPEKYTTTRRTEAQTLPASDEAFTMDYKKAYPPETPPGGAVTPGWEGTEGSQPPTPPETKKDNTTRNMVLAAAAGLIAYTALT